MSMCQKMKWTLPLLYQGSLLGKFIVVTFQLAVQRHTTEGTSWFHSLDHIITELTERFGPIQQTKVKLLGLILSIITTCTYSHASVTEVRELYKPNLPSPHLLSTEFQRWQTKYSLVPSANRPSTLEGASQFCDKKDFPNIFTLLVIACILPVTMCETERSISQLKLLKMYTYLRSTRTKKRLGSLAVIKIHWDIVADLNFDKLVVDVANKHPRRMAIPCIFSD